MSTKYPRVRRDLRRMGLGMVQLATRARTEREHRARVVLFDELVADAQVAVIRALLDGRISWEGLRDAKRRRAHGGSDVLSDIKLHARLWDTGTPGRKGYAKGAVTETLPAMGKAKATRQRYALSLQHLRTRGAQHLPADATVADLAKVEWGLLEAEWGRSAADWNHVTRAVSAFLSRYLGKRHAFTAQVREQMAPHRRAEEDRVPDLSVALFHRIVSHARADVQAALWCLALTGMRDRSEYLRCTTEHLMPETFRLRVPATKTKESKAVLEFDREDWPYIANGIPAPLQYKALRQHWIAACIKAGAGRYVPLMKDGAPVTERNEDGETVPVLRYVGLRLHDLRHFCGQLAESEGQPLSAIRAQLRHASITTTVKYAQRAGTRRVSRAVSGALRREA